MKAWRELVTKAELFEKRTPSSRGSLGRSDAEVLTGNLVQTRRRRHRVGCARAGRAPQASARPFLGRSPLPSRRCTSNRNGDGIANTYPATSAQQNRPQRRRARSSPPRRECVAFWSGFFVLPKLHSRWMAFKARTVASLAVSSPSVSAWGVGSG
jgi:hypothetical protein